MIIIPEQVKKVIELGENFQFVSDSQDTEPIKESFGDRAKEFDSFFVKIGDGEYLEVWGMFGIVRDNHKNVWKVL